MQEKLNVGSTYKAKFEMNATASNRENTVSTK